MAQCVHCLKQIRSVTLDHVFPRSWFPESTPRNQEKWTVPSCGRCNHALGRAEERLFTAFGLCLDPASTPSLGLQQRTLRSIDPSAGRTARDTHARAGKRRRVQAALVDLPALPEVGILPGFGPHNDQRAGPFVGIHVAAADLNRFGEKLARGITYYLRGILIPLDYRIHCQPSDLAQKPVAWDELVRHGRTFRWGDALTVTHASAEDDPASSFTIAELWRRLRLYVSVLPS